jgi:alanine racemase
MPSEHKLVVTLAISQRVLYVSLVLLGGLAGYGVRLATTTNKEQAVYEQGYSAGYQEGQASHCDKSRVMRGAEWLLSPKDK